MIEFHTLVIERFLSVSNAALDLHKQGLVLIEGVNKDDPSAMSNGAGKSSIVDAISWCLFGQTARGSAGDSVVNIKAGAGTFVSLIIMVDGVKYRIQRGRKHKILKNRVELVNMDAGTDLTCGTDKLTQARINGLLGCTPDIFNASIYMGQERMPDLPNMTDKVLKAILEEALALDKLDEALEICKTRLQTAFYDHDQAHRVIAVESTQLVNKNEAIVGYRAAISKAQDDAQVIEDEIVALKTTTLAELKSLVAQLDEAKRERDAAGPPMDTTAMEAVITTIAKSERSQLVLQEQTRDELVAEIGGCNGRMRDLKRQLADLAKAADGCPMCGSATTDPTHIELETKRVEQKRLEVASKHEALIKTHVETLEVVRKLKDTIAAAVSQARQQFAEDNAATAALDKEIFRLEFTIKTMRDAYESKKTSLERQGSYFTQVIDSNITFLATDVTSVKTIKETIQAAEQRAELAQAKVTTLEKVKHVLSRKGFRGEVLDQVTPFLNARTHHYLSQLTDDNIAATWSTVDFNSAGDVIESFHIDVVHKSGVKDFAALSGGEKRKVRLATALALQDLVGTRAVKPIKLFVADEIDDAIDGAGLELLMGLLEEKAKEVGTVFVISHNDISDYCRNKITVVKQDGQSTFK